MTETSFLSGQDVFFAGAAATSMYYTLDDSLVYDTVDSSFKPAASECRKSVAYNWHFCGNTRRTRIIRDRWLAEMAMWCEWNHRGHLSARTSSVVIKLDCIQVGSLVAQFDTTLLTGTRVFAILFVGHVECMEGTGLTMLDLPLDEEEVTSITNRASATVSLLTKQYFAALVPEGMVVNHDSVTRGF
uniref:Uncharacterized protein n=1 Tax=Zooxanthella nutricula TaxID=1333877 RepID=A0A7S2Q287_9DINO|eukprot:CAMPEP_0198555362 /NCGR_PEP_ID=MMETSP1462-20131121/84584_1 /TAXON_ID=1333877 /ORGANISM="Brandtodinium nutriculum, Strain RCC3387" /LENGTH=186 /DNA_ID=CAMNT_0044286087 /DNA_START=78 /DNA_END=638 /DNA_ORIENTATION=-